MKTLYRHEWEHGDTKARILSRSFPTLEEAERFAKGEHPGCIRWEVIDIYKSKGRYKVEWIKVIDNNE